MGNRSSRPSHRHEERQSRRRDNGRRRGRSRSRRRNNENQGSQADQVFYCTCPGCHQTVRPPENHDRFACPSCRYIIQIPKPCLVRCPTCNSVLRSPAGESILHKTCRQFQMSRLLFRGGECCFLHMWRRRPQLQLSLRHEVETTPKRRVLAVSHVLQPEPKEGPLHHVRLRETF